MVDTESGTPFLVLLRCTVVIEFDRMRDRDLQNTVHSYQSTDTCTDIDVREFIATFISGTVDSAFLQHRHLACPL
jgi:hypothetical protein